MQRTKANVESWSLDSQIPVRHVSQKLLLARILTPGVTSNLLFVAKNTIFQTVCKLCRSCAWPRQRCTQNRTMFRSNVRCRAVWFGTPQSKSCAHTPNLTRRRKKTTPLFSLTVVLRLHMISFEKCGGSRARLEGTVVLSQTFNSLSLLLLHCVTSRPQASTESNSTSARDPFASDMDPNFFRKTAARCHVSEGLASFSPSDRSTSRLRRKTCSCCGATSTSWRRPPSPSTPSTI